MPPVLPPAILQQIQDKMPTQQPEIKYNMCEPPQLKPTTYTVPRARGPAPLVVDTSSDLCHCYEKPMNTLFRENSACRYLQPRLYMSV